MGQLLGEQPDGALIRIHLCRKLAAFHQMHNACFRIQNAVRSHHRDGGALGICEDLCLAILDVVVGALGIEVHAEAAGGIQTADLLVEVQIHFLIDDLQGAAHAHHRTICLKHPAVAAEHAHAGADGRLRQVHRRNVARLQLLQSGAQFPAQSRNQIAARCLRRIFRTLAAHQDDGGGESIGAVAYHSPSTLCPHRPSTSNRKSGIDYGR